MKFAIAVAAVLTLGSVAAFAETAAPPAVGGRGACKADVQKFCSGVERAKGKIRACLSEHQADLSEACKQRFAHWQSKAKPEAN